MAAIIKLLPPIRSSEEARLWAAYLVTVAAFHAALPEINIDLMRACVTAYDAFMAEFAKVK